MDKQAITKRKLTNVAVINMHSVAAGSLQRPSDTRIRSWLTTATILSMIDSVTEDTDYKIRVVPIRPITAGRAGRTVRQ